MSDFALIWDDADGTADMSIEANDLAKDDGLETAVFLSLFTDAPAREGDVLPAGETDRRGWWGDLFARVPGDVMGSRLWLCSRAKDTAEVLSRVEVYAPEALQWMIDDLVASQVDVVVTRAPLSGSVSVLALAVTIHRPALDPVTYRYNYNWQSQEAKRA